MGDALNNFSKLLFNPLKKKANDEKRFIKLRVNLINFKILFKN